MNKKLKFQVLDGGRSASPPSPRKNDSVTYDKKNFLS